MVLFGSRRWPRKGPPHLGLVDVDAANSIVADVIAPRLTCINPGTAFPHLGVLINSLPAPAPKRSSHSDDRHTNFVPAAPFPLGVVSASMNLNLCEHTIPVPVGVYMLWRFHDIQQFFQPSGPDR